MLLTRLLTAYPLTDISGVGASVSPPSLISTSFLLAENMRDLHP